MHWNAGNSERSRRDVLKTAGTIGVGAGTLLTAGSGAISAIPPCAEASGDGGTVTVYDDCGTDPIARVPNGEQGEVDEVCEKQGTHVLYVIWDGDWTNGWVYESDLESCDPA